MASLFFRQFRALFWKNWIVFGKHPIVSLLITPALLHGLTRLPVRKQS